MRHFTCVQDLGDLKQALNEAFEIKKDRFQFSELGKNKTLLMIFFNSSLRTRLSTQKAAMNLGMNTIVLDVNQGAWKLETERGVIMDGDKPEHLLEAVPVMGCYCDVIGVRSFARFENKEDDYNEKILSQFIEHSGRPVFSMEAATRHPLQSFADLIIKEDIGDGDHTSLSCIPSDEHGRMRLLCKQEGIIAGIEIAQVVFHRLDPEMEFEQVLSDGDRVKPGDVAFYVSGRLRSLLQAERIILNIMQRMSGVATQTAVYVDRLAGLHTRVLDTRKTTPGMRVLDKMAVKIGGGENHRMGLFDMILLKDNHIDFAGGIRKAIHGAREYLRAKGKDIPIECEVRSLEDIDEVFAAGGVDRIMFDNFTPAMTREAVKKVAGRCETESSGGITLSTMRDYAECGVDFISVGALTHQIKSLDMSLKACE